MDKVEKQETLSKLYTLRAGLSLIAQEKDSVDAELKARGELLSQVEGFVKEEADLLKAEQENLKNSQKIFGEGIRQSEETLRLENSKLEGHIKHNKCRFIRAIARILLDLGYYIIKIIFSSGIFCLIGMGIGIAMMTDMGINQFYNPDNEVFDFVIVGIIFAIGAIIGLVSLIFLVNRIINISDEEDAPYSWDDITDTAKSAGRQIKECKANIEKEEKNLRSLKSRLENIIEQSKKDQKEYQEDYDKARNTGNIIKGVVDTVVVQLLGAHKETAVGVYNSLAEEYSELLDERDWQYIDLFIYMYETGRADSKKEALQLIDQYQQNKNIVEAIERAGREIQGSIRQGLSALQTSMERQFWALSGQIHKMHSETMLKMDRITHQLDNLNSEMTNFSTELSGIVSEISNVQSKLNQMDRQLNLNTALKAKADVSSQQLIDDVKYMRMLDEQAEIRRRNGLNSYGQYS